MDNNYVKNIKNLLNSINQIKVTDVIYSVNRKSGDKKMDSKKFIAVLSGHKDLQAMFSGMILSVMALIGMIVTAGIWYF